MGIERDAGEEFFRGIVREPDGSGERVVIRKATRALAERMATKEAERLNWDWVVEHCRVEEGVGDRNARQTSSNRSVV